MPYRTELKRPDLKGTFRCSVCHKIFCHSSSLSRHRMQAHFKSYTCTLCNKEITNNETLRAHMYKQHQISRMFMCRCCNWAFPDKTSLHIHMQAMAASGKPGNVSIIAKSATSPLPPNNSQPFGLTLPKPMSPPVPVSMVGASGSGSGIFPMIPSREEVLLKIRERVLMNGAAQAGMLASWMANFPHQVDASGVGSLGGSLNLVSPEESTESQDKNNNETAQMQSTMDDGDQHQMTIETGDDDAEGLEESSLLADANADENQIATPERKEDLPVLRSAISSSPLNSLLYKKKLESVLKRKFHVDSFLNASTDSGIDTGDAPPLKAELRENGHSHVSPSDTHSSGSSAHAQSPGATCFECQVLRGRQALADNRNRFLEGKVTSLQSQVERLKCKLSELKSGAGQFEDDCRELRKQNEVLQRKLIECQEKTLIFLQNTDGQWPESVQLFLNDMLQTTSTYLT